jgi:hypothetical protein
VDCDSFNEWVDEVGIGVATDFLERVCDGNSSDILGLESHMHNSANHTYSGVFIYKGIEYGFVIDSGDWNGTVVRSWGAGEVYNYQPPEPVLYTFIPHIKPSDTPEQIKRKWLIHSHWKNEEWFLEKERGYNYDRHFQPGLVTEKYYREWASSKGMVIAQKVPVRNPAD